MSMITKALSAIGNNLVTAREALKIAWSMPPNRTTDQWVDYYHKTPMLDPVHLIATDVAATPYKIFNKQKHRIDAKNSEPYSDHPIYDIFETPMPDHPEIDFLQIMYMTEVYYEIVGNAFWLIDRDARGKPCGVYIIPPNWMLLTPTKDIPFFRVQPMGNTSHRYFNADPSDVIWFKAPDATNPYGRGRGRTEAIGDEVETHEFSAKYAKNFFYNDAVPPIILEMPGITKPQAEEFKESWMQRLGGYLNARKPGIVGQKDFKIHQLSTTPKEMDLVESRKYLIQVANEHFSVPPELRGNLQNSNRATINSAWYLWTKNVITKRLRIFSSILNTQFVPMFDKNALWVYDEVVPDDEEFKLKVLNDGLAAGTITRNEWRIGMKLPKDDAKGDVYLTGFNIVEVPAFKKEAKPVEPEPDPAEDDEDDIKINLDAIIKELNTKSLKMTGKVQSSFTQEQRIAIWKGFDTKATKLEPLFTKQVGVIAEKQRSDLKKIVGAITDKKTMSKALDSYFGKNLDEFVRDSLKPAWLQSMATGKEHAESLLKRKKDVQTDVTNQRFTDWVSKAGLKKAKQINSTTGDDLRDMLADVIDQSIDSGDSLKVMVAKMRESVDYITDALDGYRAELIARTESASTMNFGSFATYSVAGIDKKEWLSIHDDRTRGNDPNDEFDHVSMDGEIVNMNEPFSNGLDFPADPNGEPGNIIQCRCTIAPVTGLE